MKKILYFIALISIVSFANTGGFKATDIKSNNFYSHFKILEGDIIESINGKKINALDDMMTYMANPKFVNKITVLRSGKITVYDRIKK